MSSQVVVIGSLNVDLVLQVSRRPQKGETVSGSDFATFVGGKGTNQAVAAARAGAAVTMVGRVGQDNYGEQIFDLLAASGVDTSYIVKDPSEGTGIANILVDPQGDNSIVVVPRANGKLSIDDIKRAAPAIRGAKVVLMQLEVPLETIVFAASFARQCGARVILNPAPVPPDGSLPPELLSEVDILVPNVPESELLSSLKIHDERNAFGAANVLHHSGPPNIIITMGERGALLLSGEAALEMVPSFEVSVVDTTAAGDAFCGALAACLVDGQTLHDAVRFGCAAGALATTCAGATPSLPNKDQILELMKVPSY